jgi:hypothetical protein
LNIDNIFEIRELGFAYRISQTNRYNKMYNLISKKIVKTKSEFFEERIEIGGKFKYKGTGDINVKWLSDPYMK